MQRKQFGKRGVVEPSVPQFGSRHTSHAGATMPAYGAAGASAVTFEDNDSFSIGKAFGHMLGMLFSFQGRIGRMEYWTIGTVRFILFMSLLIAFVMTAAPDVQGMSEEEANRALLQMAFGTLSGGIMTFLLLALVVCQWSLEVRRSHDRGASGFYLLIMLIPIVGSLYAIYIFVVNGFFPGTPGPNEYDTVNSQARIFE